MADEIQDPAGPWRCEHFGFVWTGDISNHHGIEPPAFCPGPHARDEMGPLLRRLHEGWRLRRDGSLVPPRVAVMDHPMDDHDIDGSNFPPTKEN